MSMKRLRVIKRNDEKGIREVVEPTDRTISPENVPMERVSYWYAMWKEGEEIKFTLTEDDRIEGYVWRYGSDEMRSSLRSPHVALGKIAPEEFVKKSLMEDTLENLKKLRGSLEARTKRVKDRGILDALPFLIPRITIEDLEKTHGILITDKPVEHIDSLIISSDGEPVREKEDASTKILERLIEIYESVNDVKAIENDFRISLERYHSGNTEELLKILSVKDADLSEIPSIVRKMSSLGLKAAPIALVASVSDRLKKDIASLLAALAIYRELSHLSIAKLVDRISANAPEIILKAKEEEAQKARRELRDLMPDLAKAIAKELLLKRDLSDAFASELSIADLSREERIEVLKKAEKLKRREAVRNLYVTLSVDEVKSLGRSPEYTLEIASIIKAPELFNRLLETRLADKAAEKMVEIGLINEELKLRLLKFSARNPLRAAEIAKRDKKLFKRLMDSIYDKLDASKFSLILADNVDVIEKDRLEERIPKRLERHEPSERLIDVVVAKKAFRSAELLALRRAKVERRELVNKIVEGFEKKDAKKIVESVTEEESMLTTLALKPMLALKRYKEGLLPNERFEKILPAVLNAVGFDDVIEVIKMKKLSEEALLEALDIAVKKADSWRRVIDLIEFSASVKRQERVRARLASQAKLLEPEASEEFVSALRLLGDIFSIEYASEKPDKVRETLKKLKDAYLGRIFVIANPKLFEEKRRDLGSEVASYVTPEVQILVPRVTKALALEGSLKPSYPFEVYRYAGRIPEYLEELREGRKVKIDAKNLDSVGELKILASAIRNASYVSKQGPIALAHAIGAIRILSHDLEIQDIYRKIISKLPHKATQLREMSVKLPPGFFGGKAKEFSRDTNLQLSIIRHIVDAPYLEAKEDSLVSIDSQWKIELKRAKKKLIVSIKRV